MYRFAGHELDAARFELRRQGTPVDVQPKVLDLLLVLVRNRDRVVSKEELFETLWSGTAVTDASLSKAVAAARRALGDDARSPHCIETLRGRGFRFVAPVEEETVAVAGAAASFVGRSAALGSIGAALDSARGGAGRLVLLVGEGGIGKTSTAREAVHLAEGRGMTVVEGWCPDSGETPALWPWSQVFRRLLDERSGERSADPGLVRGLEVGLSEFLELHPEPREHGEGRPETQLLEPTQARLRLLDTAAELLRRTAARTPLLVSLDDFHRADPASVALLDHVVHELHGLQAVVLVAYRDDELGASHPLRALARRPDCEIVELSGLERGDVARLLAHELDEPPAAATLDQVLRATGGNPFFVKEMARRIRGGGVPAGAPPLSSGIRQLLTERLGGLSRDCREVLDAAALIGGDFAPGLLATVVDAPGDRVLAHLDEAGTRGVVEACGDVWRFSHALMREAIVEATSSSSRARIHWRIGQALERLHPAPSGPQLFALAHHSCAGAAAGEPRAAAARALEVAERAGGQLAYEESAAFARRGLAALSLARGPEPVLQLGLSIALGEALRVLGDPEAREVLLDAAERARELGDAPLLARAALAFGGLELSMEIGINDPELVRLLGDAYEALPLDPTPLRVRVVSRLGIALWWADRDRSRSLWPEFEQMARTAPDPLARAHALFGRRWLLSGPSDLEQRLAEAGELRELARSVGSRELELAGCAGRFIDLMELGRLEDADRELAAYESLAEASRIPRFRYRVHVYRAMRALLAGDFAAAEQRALLGLREGSHFGAQDAQANFGAIALTLRREQGRVSEMLEPLEGIAARRPGVAAWQAALPMIRAELGRQREARAGLDRLAHTFVAADDSDFMRVPCLCFLGETAHALGDRRHAQALLGALAGYSGRMLLIGLGVVCWGAVDRILGNLAITCRDFDQAERYLGQARALEARAGALPWRAWTDLSHAELYLERGSEGDEDRASRALAAAEALGRELGMVRLLERAAKFS